MSVLIIDNYDSFTYNLVQVVGSFYSDEIHVYRNDEINLDEIRKLDPDRIIISPGPGHPEHPRDFGVSRDAIQHLGKEIPLLGVCLGHQGIAAVFGGQIIPASKIMHGKTSAIYHNGSALFKEIKSPFEAMRYHSLLIDPDSIPAGIRVTAKTNKGEIMAIEHQHYPIYGVQFHPESAFTGLGKKILENFVALEH